MAHPTSKSKAEKAHFERVVREEVERILADTWIKGSELYERNRFFSENWLKKHGDEIPRYPWKNAWYYSFGAAKRMLEEKLITIN